MSGGRVLGTKKIVDRGPGSERWDLVFLGDGYTESEIGKYERDVDMIVAAMLATPPFDALQAAINVHRVNVASNDSGTTDLCRQTPRTTFFESRLCAFNVERLLVANNTTAALVASDEVREVNAVTVMVNSTEYGGSGDPGVAVFSTATEASEIALHEMGHSFFNLGDEYAECADSRYGTWAGAESPKPNISRSPAGKWPRFIQPGTPLPTTRNPDCARCDPQPSPVAPGTVGAFEGAGYYRCGLYRPEFNCRMRELRYPFCAVCTETIHRALEPYLPRRRRSVRS